MTAQQRTPDGWAGFRWLLRVPIDPMTYRSLGYLLLAMPLGLAYFIILTVGFSLSVGLLVLLIGPLVLIATLLMVRGMAWIDGMLTKLLLEANIALSFPATESLQEFLRELLLGRATWFGLLYIGWKAVLGMTAFVLLITGFSLSLSVFLLPFYYGDGVYFIPALNWWEINTAAGSLSLAVLGGFVVYGTLALTNVLGHLSRMIAERLLVT